MRHLAPLGHIGATARPDFTRHWQLGLGVVPPGKGEGARHQFRHFHAFAQSARASKVRLPMGEAVLPTMMVVEAAPVAGSTGNLCSREESAAARVDQHLYLMGVGTSSSCGEGIYKPITCARICGEETRYACLLLFWSGARADAGRWVGWR